MRKIFGPTKAGFYTFCSILGALTSAPLFFK